ncbi:MAG: CDP-alcohol phosphatidyltransferase family protein [Alphaproteobacteria bacterium]|nr:CDP-alcohol phosphatidyltransferase family protein [Alphaproteobacteria bacterium]
MTRALLGLIPNLITLARLLAVPLVVWLILTGRWAPAFWVFVAASITDGLDGSLARAFDARSLLGAYLDAIADKALLVSVYITLGQAGQIPLWLVILVVSRDVLIVGGVLLLHTVDQAPAMAPILISKANTVAQLVLAGMVLADVGLGIVADGVVPTLIVLVAATTIASGGAYLVGWGRGHIGA